MTVSDIHIRDAEGGEMRPLRSNERVGVDLHEVTSGAAKLAAEHGLTPAEQAAAADMLRAAASELGGCTVYGICREVSEALDRLERARPGGDPEMRALHVEPFLKALERLIVQGLRVVSA